MIRILRQSAFFALLITGTLFLSSWGYQGHKKISEPAAPALPSAVDFLKSTWTAYLPAHASDADYRKQSDPNESPRHFIDIDGYSAFVQNGKIPMSWDSIVAVYGYNYVIDQGILPWATKTAYDSLKACFQRTNWDRAAMFAADLGHYVGDGHMPLHITKNYNGQLTGQTGVHSRYETKMINDYVGQIIYETNEAQQVQDVQGYIFTYIYSNYKYVDSVLIADRHASDSAGTTSGSAYLAAFWQNSGAFTTKLFKNASQSLADLIYTAWVEAGSPTPQGVPGEPFASVMKEVFPNPGIDSVTIPFDIITGGIPVSLTILDNEGKIVENLLENKILNLGSQEIIWNCAGKTPGMYYALLSSEGVFSVKKVVVVK
ncbi:MAG: hypothetical protein ACM3N9_02565 [Syntrophothermus sp.]